MTNSEQAIREFAEKWGYTISVNKKGELYNANCKRKLLSDLTALISEHYYPKEFIEWMIKNTMQATTYSPMLYMKYQTKQEREQNNMQIYNLSKEWHIDDLLNYWKENKR